MVFNDELSSDEDASPLDIILTKLGKKFGTFQIITYLVLIVPTIISCAYTVPYVFTSRNLEYRCYIPECDDFKHAEYNPSWLRNAVPFKNNIPSRCNRYKYVNHTLSNRTCCANCFEHDVLETCDKFVFETNYVTILNDFDLTCDNNEWKLTIVGTINGFGYFVGLPLAGYISDRFGRRTLMIVGIVMASVFGLARSFSPTYLWYLAFEFIEPAFGSGTYSTGFVLGLELVAPDKRALMSSLISMCCALGEALSGLVAWSTFSWRNFLRYLYGPGILLIMFYRLVPESITWLLAKGRHKEVQDYLRKAAKINNVQISEDELKTLECEPQEELKETESYPIKEVLQSRILLLRLLNCCYCWVVCNFIFYGLSLNSVAIAGNVYLNFIAVSLVEIPGYFCTYLILDRFGRRLSLFGSLILSAAGCIAFIFVPEDIYWLQLSVYLFGKFSITIAYSVLYVLTTELFPTPLRNSLFCLCALMGNVGSMPAPQVPLMSQVMESLPLILFGSLSLSSGFLALLFPETLNKKLPDTIEEAENLRNAPRIANQHSI